MTRLRTLDQQHRESGSAEASQTEREEALWCEVVRLRHRIKGLEESLALRDEVIALQREKLAASSPSLSVPTLPPANEKFVRQIVRRKSRTLTAGTACHHHGTARGR